MATGSSCTAQIEHRDGRPGLVHWHRHPGGRIHGPYWGKGVIMKIAHRRMDAPGQRRGDHAGGVGATAAGSVGMRCWSFIRSLVRAHARLRELILPCDRSKLAIQLKEWRLMPNPPGHGRPLGWAGHKYCIRNGFRSPRLSTPDSPVLHAALQIPLAWGYALFRRTIRPSAGLWFPTREVLSMLARRGATTCVHGRMG